MLNAGQNLLSLEMSQCCILQMFSGRPLKEGSLTNNFLILSPGGVLIYTKRIVELELKLTVLSWNMLTFFLQS